MTTNQSPISHTQPDSPSYPEAHTTKRLVRPWVRYWARYFDTFIWLIVVGLCLAELPMDFSLPINMLVDIVFLALWIPLEAVLLSSIGATPGKLLLGVIIRNPDGSKLSFRQAFRRSTLVWWRGDGAFVPIISFVANLNGYQNLKHNLGETTWDRDLHLVVTHRPRLLWSEILLYCVIAMILYWRLESGFIGL